MFRRLLSVVMAVVVAGIAGFHTVHADSSRSAVDALAAAPLPIFASRIDDVRGMDYAAEVAPGLLRGSQPNAEGVAWLKARGIRTVINLRRFHKRTERAQVEAAGMRYVHIPLEASDPPTDAQIDRFFTQIRDESLKPIFVHCAQGVDRTGTMMAIYRMEIEGWTNAHAFAEMKAFGANRIWFDLRAFVRSYRPRGLRKAE